MTDSTDQTPCRFYPNAARLVPSGGVDPSFWTPAAWPVDWRLEGYCWEHKAFCGEDDDEAEFYKAHPPGYLGLTGGER